MASHIVDEAGARPPTSQANTVAQQAQSRPNAYDAAPSQGNFTEDASAHLWCASALAILVATPEMALEEINDDAQAALRYLLQCEIRRARHAEAAEQIKLQTLAGGRGQ